MNDIEDNEGPDVARYSTRAGEHLHHQPGHPNEQAHRVTAETNDLRGDTAAAIASFAFNKPYAVVDGNVFRVLSRVFGIETPIDSSKGKKEFYQLANELIDKKNPALFNQAVEAFLAKLPP